LREKMIHPQTIEDPETKKPITRPGWCRTHANRQIKRVCQVFSWAVGQEMIAAQVHQALLAVEPLRKGRSEARETAPIRCVAEQHVDQVIVKLPPAVRALVELQELCGARGGELFKLRGVDIDMSPTSPDGRRDCIDCTKTKPCPKHSVWLYKPRLHKTAYLGHEREIRFGPRAQGLLRPFLKSDLNAPLFSPVTSEATRRAEKHRDRIDDGTPLSCGNVPGSNRTENPERPAGVVYTKDSYNRAIARACDAAFPPPEHVARARVPAAGRKGKKSTRWETAAEWKARLGPSLWAELVTWQKAHRFHPHQLRHSTGTKVRRGYGLDAAQAVLGQRTVSAAQVYAEVSGAAADRVISEIG
jgi:hypothetical protein